VGPVLHATGGEVWGVAVCGKWWCNAEESLRWPIRPGGERHECRGMLVEREAFVERFQGSENGNLLNDTLQVVTRCERHGVAEDGTSIEQGHDGKRQSKRKGGRRGPTWWVRTRKKRVLLRSCVRNVDLLRRSPPATLRRSPQQQL
jgi:hypothetical protein